MGPSAQKSSAMPVSRKPFGPICGDGGIATALVVATLVWQL